MTTDTEGTTQRLPHTGMWVPDRSLSVTAYRELQTYDGVAYRANLRLNNRIVGVIENGGHGGETVFGADDWRSFGEAHLDGYAARCRTEEGEPVTAENLLDELIDEHDWTGKTAAARRRGRMLLRLMDHSLAGDNEPIGGFPPYPHGEASSAVPRNDKQWAELTTQVTAEMPPGRYGWWQAWTGTSWRDVTPRPKGVSPQLYT